MVTSKKKSLLLTQLVPYLFFGRRRAEEIQDLRRREGVKTPFRRAKHRRSFAQVAQGRGRGKLSYYLNLNWSFIIEQEKHRGKTHYIIRVNELPGVCTDADSIEEGMDEIYDAIKAAIKLYLKQGDPIPEPVDKKKFKGNISYRTTSERHYKLAKLAARNRTSLSKAIDLIIDSGIERLGNPRLP